MKGRRDADGLRCAAAKHTDRRRRSEEKIVVHALDDDDWTRRSLRNSPLAHDWFKSLIGLIGLERDWFMLRCYVVRGFHSGRWIAFGQLTPRETKFHSDLIRIQLTNIFGYEGVLEQCFSTRGPWTSSAPRCVNWRSMGSLFLNSVLKN